MNYKKILLGILLSTSSSLVVAADNGQTLFEGACASCHSASGPATIAPPVFAVVNHVKSAHPEKEQFVEKIVSWVANPTEETALMRGAIKKFGLMPKLEIAPVKVKLIAEYLYDGNIALPDWYIEHYKEEHGHEPKQ